MSDEQTQSPEVDPQSPKPAAKSRWSRIGTVIIAIGAVIYGGIRLINLFVLPGCDASNITDTVRDLFKSKDVELVVFNDIEALPDEDEKTMCGAHVESADGKADIRYSIVWQGWSPYVTIEKVDDVPADPKPAD